MDNLTELNKAIEDSIDKVYRIPTIKTDNFNTDKLKDEVIPLLKEAKNRLKDIEYINNNINGIRNEIINPVSDVIKDKSKQSNWFAILGMIFGILGAALTASSFFFDEINLDSNSISKIEDINKELLDKKLDEEVEKKMKSQIFAELNKEVWLIEGTYEGGEAVHKLKAYLKEAGYQNIKTKVDLKYGREKDKYYKRMNNTIPYIYYRQPVLKSEIIRGVEKSFRYYGYGRYGRIIGIMHFKKTTRNDIQEAFLTNQNLELIIAM